jgi:hypothetical protein
MPPREKPIKGVRDTAITILGSRPDIGVASIVTPREFMEYPYLIVFQDDKKKPSRGISPPIMLSRY